MSKRSLALLSASIVLMLSWASILVAQEGINPQEEPATPPQAVEQPATSPSTETPTPQPSAETPTATPSPEEPQSSPAMETEEKPAPAETSTTGLTIDKMVVCTGIEEREPVGEGTLFQSGVGKLYCFSLVLGAEEPTVIHHVWYWNDQKMADIPLTIRSSRFRTYSSKNILPQWKGAWRVELTGPKGEILSTAAFNVE